MNSIEREVLQTIGESLTSPDVFTDDSEGMALIRRSVNDAIGELAMTKGGYRRTYYLPLFADRTFYRLGYNLDHFGYVVGASDRSRHWRLTQTDPLELSASDPYWLKRSSNQPTHYLQIGYEIVGLWPKPSASGGVIELDCVVIPGDYTEETDPIRIRPNWERAACDLALSEFYASRGDARRATDYYASYLETGLLHELKPERPEEQYRFGGWRNRP